MRSLILGASLLPAALAQYQLVDDYVSGGNFFDKFTFDTYEPTHGFVQYQDRGSAQSRGLISSSSSNVRMGVDHTNVTPNSRPSVRITSTKTYSSGLFILDLQHMPGGICGTWPAFWYVWFHLSGSIVADKALLQDSRKQLAQQWRDR